MGNVFFNDNFSINLFFYLNVFDIKIVKCVSLRDNF